MRGLLRLFTQSITRKTADRNRVASLFLEVGNEVFDRLVAVLDESLLEETVRCVEFPHLSTDDFFDDLSRFVFHLLAENVFFLFHEIGRNFVPVDTDRLSRGNMKRKVLYEIRK